MNARVVTLPGLPAEGPPPEQYTVSGMGTHREGFVVEFHPCAHSSWIGNFQRGQGDCELVVRHCDGASFIVIAAGQAYVVDPASRALHDMFTVESHFWVDVPQSNTLLLTNGRWFEAYGGSGRLWRTRAISWDTVRDISVSGLTLRGEAYTVDGTWRAFAVDLATGIATGGSLAEP